MSVTSLPAAFKRLAWSNLAAQTAEQIGLAAAPLIAVLSLGAGAGETGLLQTAQTLPFLLLSFPAGVLADRSSRRRLMAGAEALRALALVGIMALATAGLLTLPLLALLGFLGAAGTVAYSITAPSLVPALVPRADLAAANGRIELARAVAFVAGPALAGALIARIGAAPSYAVAGALSVLAVVLLAGIAEPARTTAPARRFLQDLREGAGFAFRHPLLRPVLLTAVFFNTAWFVLQAVYVPYAIHHLGLTAIGVGTTLAAYGVGMVAGALLAPRIARRVTFGAMVSIGPLAGLASALVMAATIRFPSIELASVSFFLIGAGPILWVISSTTLRQAVTPADRLGRVGAIVTMATAGARPLGAAIGAVVGAAYGAETCLLVSLAGFAIQAAVILASPVARLIALPEVVEG